METVKYYISTISELREVTHWLKTLNILNSTGFYRDFNIKVNAKTPRGKGVLIDFYFNNKNYYSKFKRVLRNLEKS